MPFKAINPATGETLASYPDDSRDQAFAQVERAHEAHLAWRETSMRDRSTRLYALGRLLLERKGELARLMTAEMGKPIAQSVAEIEKCALVASYYGEHAHSFLHRVPVDTDATRSYWAYRPLGVILGIMPWNFPFWQAIRFATPALAAGNGAVLKHAPSVPGCALALEALYQDAGFPAGLFSNVFVDTEVTGDLIEHPHVQGVSLTGSVRAGRAVASRAGQALKKCVLELGGSDPSVILADADLDTAVVSCVLGRLQNTGQSCIAAKRFVVVESVRQAFEERLIAGMAATLQGDPLDPAVGLGPMAREDLRDTLHGQVVHSVEAGATLALGGTIPPGSGAWYPATVLTGVGPGMPAYDEELFGPVAAVISARDESEAIHIANDTTFGLGASVYTADPVRGERIAAELLDAGSCFVNGFVKSDPRLPFGGVKDSGYGRELSPLGIREFTNVKTVWIR